MLGSDPHEHLPEAFSLHETTERRGGAGQSVCDVFPVAKQPGPDPTSNHHFELRKALQVVLDDNATQGGPRGQDCCERRSRRLNLHVVCLAHSTKNDPRVWGEEQERAREDFTAHIIEVNVHSVRAGTANLRRQVRGAIVDARREAELIDRVVTLLGRAGNSNCPRPDDAGRLASGTADRTGGIRNQDGLARPRLDRKSVV